MSSASTCALLRMDLSTKRVWSSISMPEILTWQRKTKKKTQKDTKREIIMYSLSSLCDTFQRRVGGEKNKIVPTWSCWSCWLDPASPRASDSSNTDCRCYKSYLEARAAGQPMAWLYLGSGLDEQKVNTVFCFPDGWIVTDIMMSIFFCYFMAIYFCTFSLLSLLFFFLPEPKRTKTW